MAFNLPEFNSNLILHQQFVWNGARHVHAHIIGKRRLLSCSKKCSEYYGFLTGTLSGGWSAAPLHPLTGYFQMDTRCMLSIRQSFGVRSAHHLLIHGGTPSIFSILLILIVHLYSLRHSYF